MSSDQDLPLNISPAEIMKLIKSQQEAFDDLKMQFQNQNAPKNSDHVHEQGKKGGKSFKGSKSGKSFNSGKGSTAVTDEPTESAIDTIDKFFDLINLEGTEITEHESKSFRTFVVSSGKEFIKLCENKYDDNGIQTSGFTVQGLPTYSTKKLDLWTEKKECQLIVMMFGDQKVLLKVGDEQTFYDFQEKFFQNNQVKGSKGYGENQGNAKGYGKNYGNAKGYGKNHDNAKGYGKNHGNAKGYGKNSYDGIGADEFFCSLNLGFHTSVDADWGYRIFVVDPCYVLQFTSLCKARFDVAGNQQTGFTINGRPTFGTKELNFQSKECQAFVMKFGPETILVKVGNEHTWTQFQKKFFLLSG